MTFESIVEDGTFAHNEQMLHFPQYFHVNIAFSETCFLAKDAFIVNKSINTIWSKGLFENLIGGIHNTS